MSKGPNLPDYSTFIQAGIDPKTRLPVRAINHQQTKEGIRACMRIMDEQDAITRYEWSNTALDLSTLEIERLLYYKSDLCFFYLPETEKFYLMPYALDGTIDFYGRYNHVHPVPMSSGTTQKENGAYDVLANYLAKLKLQVLYDVPIEPVDPTKVCVILHDYTPQLSQKNITRKELQEPILDIMSEIIPMARTALKNSTGVEGLRVPSEDEYSNVIAANKSVDDATIAGQRFIPVVGALEFQDLAGGVTAKSQDFLQCLELIDNYRLSLYGLDNGGFFDKKAYVNKTQASMNGNSSSPLQDGLLNRQKFCDIINAVWGVGISCDISEIAMGGDTNMDGQVGDEQDQGGMPGDQEASSNNVGE